jgi:hypothetical protein
MKLWLKLTILLGAWVIAPPSVFTQAPTTTQLESPLVDERSYVGNIYGNVFDSTSSQPIPGARIYVYDPEAIWEAAHQNRTKPDLKKLRQDAFERPQAVGVSDTHGSFLIPALSTPFPYRVYTVIAMATGYSMEILDRVRVFPGGSMALRVDFHLDRGSQLPIFHHGDDPEASYWYRHEEMVYQHPIEQQTGVESALTVYNFAGPFSSTVFATREGLVGGTTANGHVIVPNDHFVALPSRKALSSNGGHEFEVEISYGGHTAVMPQWDVGPWNIRDDYWNPATLREKFQDLPQGMPEAQAAFQNSYNNGMDGGDTSRGPRKVLNPAGIDLADGTFWQDLQLPDNSFINVKFLWLVQYVLSTMNGRSLSSSSTATQMRVGSALITPNSGQTVPEGFLFFSNRSDGDITYEASVAPSTPLQRGLLLVELSGSSNSSVSLANPSTDPVDVTLKLLSPSGQDYLATSPGTIVFVRTLILGARQQQTVSLSTLIQSTSGPVNFLGAVLIEASKPILVVGLRTRTNSRGDLITTTTPAADAALFNTREVVRTGKSDLGASSPSPFRSEETLFWLPVIRDGGGNSTTFELLNPLAHSVSGTVLFFDSDGQQLTLKLEGQGTTSFRYSLEPGGSLQKASSGDGAAIRSGYALILPDRGSYPPQAVGIISSQQNGILIALAGLAGAQPAKNHVVYVDRRSSRDTSVSLVNPGTNPVSVQWSLTPLDGGQILSSSTMTIAPQQRVEIVASLQFPNLPDNFEGILRLDAAAPLAAAALHQSGNTRGETIFAALPVFGASRSLATSLIPYLEDGAGRQTQLVLINLDPQTPRSGSVNLFSPAGTTLNLGFK